MKQALTSKNNIAIQEIVPDKLFKEMSDWSDRIRKRAYEWFAASGFSNGHDVDHWLKAESELLKPMTLELKDSDNKFVVKAALQGFDAKDLQIHVNGKHLVIQGKHEFSEQKKLNQGKTFEYKSEEIYRALELPAPIVAERANAELKNGVLEIMLPKAEKAKEIKAAAA